MNEELVKQKIERIFGDKGIKVIWVRRTKVENAIRNVARNLISNDLYKFDLKLILPDGKEFVTSLDDKPNLDIEKALNEKLKDNGISL